CRVSSVSDKTTGIKGSVVESKFLSPILLNTK
ncbi:MAG: hypothetical protein ACI91R_000708, partial [Vicingaceae bacterium]